MAKQYGNVGLMSHSLVLPRTYVPPSQQRWKPVVHSAGRRDDEAYFAAQHDTKPSKNSLDDTQGTDGGEMRLLFSIQVYST